jgi:hypothetical protein
MQIMLVVVMVAMAVLISAVTALTPSRTQVVSVVTGRGLTSLPHSRSKSDDKDGGMTTKAVLESQRMSLTRRMVLLHQLLFSTASAAFVANAAETIGKDENCDVASCVGVWDGLLADCPHNRGGGWGGGGAGCVSSQDDTPGIFAEPWDYADDIPLIPSSLSSSSSSFAGRSKNDVANRMDDLILTLGTTSRNRGDTVIVQLREGRYLRALIVDANTGEESVCEFYFTPDDTTVQFRLGAVSSSSPASIIGVGRRSLSNAERSERLRKALRYTKVPVLRNRKRALFFVESDDFDAFGPGSAALGPPEEMSPGEMVLDGAIRFGLGGRERTQRGSDNVDPKMMIDWVESFPLKDTKRER